MKKIAISVVLLLSLLLTTSCGKKENKTKKVKVEKAGYLYAWIDRARIRKAPGLKGNSIGNLDEGERVYFTGEKSELTAKVTLRGNEFNSPFYKIKTKNGTVGWVYAGAFQKDKLAPMKITVKFGKSALIQKESSEITKSLGMDRLYNLAEKKLRGLRDPNWRALPKTFVITSGTYWLFVSPYDYTVRRNEGPYGNAYSNQNQWTGDGTTFKLIRYQPGKKITILQPEQMDGNGGCMFSCPYFYLMDKNKTFVKRGEIIRDLWGKHREDFQVTKINLKNINLKNKNVKILIKEEKDEISYVDYVALKVNGKVVLPNSNKIDISQISTVDKNYMIMKKGDHFFLNFDLTSFDKIKSIEILSAGYYTVAK